MGAPQELTFQAGKASAQAGRNLTMPGTYKFQQTATSLTLASEDNTNAIYSATFTDDLGGKVLIAGLEIETPFETATVSLKVQGGDGTNWTDIITLIDNVVPSTVGVTYTTLDLSNTYIPVIRFVMNSENQVIKDTANGTLNFRLSTPT
jgi:hypothetical protein